MEQPLNPGSRHPVKYRSVGPARWKFPGPGSDFRRSRPTLTIGYMKDFRRISVSPGAGSPSLVRLPVPPRSWTGFLQVLGPIPDFSTCGSIVPPRLPPPSTARAKARPGSSDGPSIDPILRYENNGLLSQNHYPPPRKSFRDPAQDRPAAPDRRPAGPHLDRCGGRPRAAPGLHATGVASQHFPVTPFIPPNQNNHH